MPVRGGGGCVGTLDPFIFIAVGGGLVAHVLKAEVGDARDARVHEWGREIDVV